MLSLTISGPTTAASSAAMPLMEKASVTSEVSQLDKSLWEQGKMSATDKTGGKVFK